MEIKHPIYKATADFGISAGGDVFYAVSLNYSRGAKNHLHLRYRSLVELRKAVNKELKKVRREIRRENNG